MITSIDLGIGESKTAIYVNPSTLTSAKGNKILHITSKETNVIDIYCRLLNLTNTQTIIYKYMLEKDNTDDNLTINKIANALIAKCRLSAIQLRRVIEDMISSNVLARRENRCVYLNPAYNINNALVGDDTKIIAIELTKDITNKDNIH